MFFSSHCINISPKFILSKFLPIISPFQGFVSFSIYFLYNFIPDLRSFGNKRILSKYRNSKLIFYIQNDFYIFWEFYLERLYHRIVRIN